MISLSDSRLSTFLLSLSPARSGNTSCLLLSSVWVSAVTDITQCKDADVPTPASHTVECLDCHWPHESGTSYITKFQLEDLTPMCKISPDYTNFLYVAPYLYSSAIFSLNSPLFFRCSWTLPSQGPQRPGLSPPLSPSQTETSGSQPPKPTLRPWETIRG